MNDNQSYHIKRSYKYMCFQNQAHHFQNLMNTKHCIENRLDQKSPIYRKISPEKEVGAQYKLNQKRRKEVDRIINNENQKLLKKLQEIMEPKSSNNRSKHSNQDSMIYTRLSSAQYQNTVRSNSKNHRLHDNNNNNTSLILGIAENSTTANSNPTAVNIVKTNSIRAQSPSEKERGTNYTTAQNSQGIQNQTTTLTAFSNSNSIPNSQLHLNHTNTNNNNIKENTNNNFHNHSKSKQNNSVSNGFNSTSNAFNSTYKRQSELSSIERENFKIAKKITECKPQIGTIGEWNQHYQKFKKNCSIRRVTTISNTGINYFNQINNNSAYDSVSSQLNYYTHSNNNNNNIIYTPTKTFSSQQQQQGQNSQSQDQTNKNKMYQNGNQIQSNSPTTHYSNFLKNKEHIASAGLFNKTNLANGYYAYQNNQSLLFDRKSSAHVQTQTQTQNKPSQYRVLSSQQNSRNNYYRKNNKSGQNDNQYYYYNKKNNLNSSAILGQDTKDNSYNNNNYTLDNNVATTTNEEQSEQLKKHKILFTQNYNTMINNYSEKYPESNNLSSQNIENRKQFKLQPEQYQSQINPTFHHNNISQQQLINHKSQTVFQNQQMKIYKRKNNNNSNNNNNNSMRNKSNNRLERSMIDPRSIEFERLQNTEFDFITNPINNQQHQSHSYALSHHFNHKNNTLYSNSANKKHHISDIGFSDDDEHDVVVKQQQQQQQQSQLLLQQKNKEIELIRLSNVNLNEQDQEKDSLNGNNSDNYDEKIKQIQDRYIKLEQSYNKKDSIIKSNHSNDQSQEDIKNNNQNINLESIQDIKNDNNNNDLIQPLVQQEQLHDSQQLNRNKENNNNNNNDDDNSCVIIDDTNINS